MLELAVFVGGATHWLRNKAMLWQAPGRLLGGGTALLLKTTCQPDLKES